MKVAVDRSQCTAHGICEALAPDTFEIDSSGELVLLTEDVHDDALEDVRAAVAGCPAAALTLTATHERQD